MRVYRFRLLFPVILLLLSISISAQTDTEFWFSVPEINRYHYNGDETNPANKGYPVYLRITTGNLPSTVTITMPANQANFNGGNPLVFNIPANKTQTIDLAALNLIGDDKTTALTSIENRLRWTTSNASAINRNNKGLHIEATTPVTIYYEISAIYNMELLALKGKNALGQQFYIPFETTYEIIKYATNDSKYTYRPYSSFDIVATEDNTQITITPTKDVFVWPNSFKPANIPFTITLNRGETAIIAPYKNDSNVKYKTDPKNTLAGTKVEVVSGGDIAVISRHDMVNPTGGVDFVGDQLVPIDHIGNHYAVVRGGLADAQEHVYVVGTQNGTQVKVNGSVVATINERGVLPVQIPSANLITTIETDKPVYVYHLSGFGNGSYTQVAGAIIPTITTCTGSTRVGFNRTKANYDNGYGNKYYDFYMNILVRKGAEDGFKLYDKNGNDVTAIVPGLNNPASYQDVGATAPFNQWRYARFMANNIQAGVDEAYLLANEKDVFHLGILNGNPYADAFYGYFSDFNSFNPNAFVVVNEAGGNKICWGESRQLYASGGTHYQWTPHDFLDNPSSPTPVASNITHSIKYNVTVSGACGLSDTREVNFLVSEPVVPSFTTDQFAGCAPFSPQIINNSIGAATNVWDFNNDGDIDDPGEGTNNNVTFTPSVPFLNSTTDTLRYTLSLVVTDNTGICVKSFKKDILVYPHIDISPVIDSKSDPNNCHPLTVNFKANPTGNHGTATFRWDFGDGATSASPDPAHTYYNYNSAPTTYNAQLTLTDKYNFCSVTKPVPVTVQPYIRANFAVERVTGCSPFSVLVTNNSTGGITAWQWDKDGDGAFDSTDPANWTFSKTNSGGSPLPTTIKLRVQNSGGCINEYSQTITVNPTPTANVNVNTSGDIVCSPLDVNLAATNVTNANTFEWHLIDGSNTNIISTQQSTTYQLQNNDAFAHSYNIRFKALNQYGCEYLSNLFPVTVQPFVDAQFSVTPTGNCSPVDLNFTVQKFPGINQFQWDWDNNGTPDATYTQAGQQSAFTRQEVNQTGITRNFQPVLTVANIAGCKRSKQLDLPIPIYPEVTANFDLPAGSQCNPASLTLTNTSTYTGGAALTNGSYQWSFGDGSTSMETSPSHVFTNTSGTDKSFNISLTATSEHGCQSAVIKTLTVYPYIKPEFSIDNLAGCAPHSYNINLTTHPGISQYEFDFDGDGNIDQTYTSATVPSVIPRTQDNLTGVEKLYNVSLRVRNSAGCTDNSAIPVRVYPGVTSSFTPTVDQTICEGASVNFVSNSVVNGTTNHPQFTSWSFGDGLTSNLQSVSHTFNNDDTQNSKSYTVNLTVSNIHGCSDTETRTVTVHPKLTNGFTMQMSGNCTPFNVTFTPTAIGATQYQWTFDGLFPNENRTDGNPFTYEADNNDPDNVKNHTISLVTSNANGNCVSQPVTKTLSVYPRIVPQASALSQFACPGTPIEFTNSSTGGNLLFYWEFADGQSFATTQQDNITHYFDNRTSTDKQLNVTLWATNANGCSMSTSVPVTIHPRVEADFTMSYDSICVPFDVKFTNTSLNGTNFNWDYGYTLGGVPQQQTTARPTLSHTYTFDNDLLNTIIKPTITLTATQSHANSGLTCSSAKSVPFIDIYPKVVAGFNLDTDRGCTPLTVNFANSSTGLGSYTWDFGNGMRSTETSPQGIVFINTRKDNLATYKVWLKSINAIGCADSTSRTITVNPKVEAAFTWDKTAGCSPVNISFNNTSTSALYQYSWNFGDGSPTTHAEQPGMHTYTNLGLTIQNPKVTLITQYKDDISCADTLELPLSIYPRIYPDFTYNPAGCTPHLVQFTNQTQSFSTNNQYVWNLGNGNYAYSANVEQEYKNTSTQNEKNFTITLKATSEHGCIDSVKKDVTVYPRPVAAMELKSNYISCPPFNVEIENKTLGSNLTYHYDFGDGADSTTTSPLNMVHVFDNTQSVTQSYQIWLHAKNNYGCDDAISQTIQVFPRVTARFDASPGYMSCSPFDVQFSNLSTNAKIYTWNFGDGFNSSSTNPSQSFLNDTENDKVYNVKLTARSEFDCVDDTVKQITVWATPRALIGVEPPLKEFPDNTFNIINQSSPAADSWHYKWYFDDNTYSTDKNPGTHSYTRWGHKEKGFTYDVSLAVNSPHCKDSTSKIVYLMPPKPIADFTQSQANGCAPHEVHFVNNSQYGENYEWDFDDGSQPVIEFQPIHVFSKPGYYRVKLKVTGEGGENFDYGIIRVYPTPNADFVAYPSRVMLPDATVRLQNLTTDCDSCSYDWDMGDGTKYINQKDPNHTYKGMGEFRISLWAERKYSDAICRDSISKYPAVWVEGIGYVKFPDAFKPNPSGPNGGAYDEHDMKNEVFHPIHYGVVEYKLMIFTRWGEQVFTSSDVKVGWDGYINGRLAEQGVYVWRAIGTFTNGKVFDQRGTVTLLR